ncbi:hypothetical protein [Corynebacterium lizhenjunii]|uniref:hypothetical protein n=1 Tax=Corynebacterium lizhenjunii TaxID=2709394 RepID=UPI001FD0B3D0|nr:hypothetical protein [Corynebacterium lizhenjunii]
MAYLLILLALAIGAAGFYLLHLAKLADAPADPNPAPAADSDPDPASVAGSAPDSAPFVEPALAADSVLPSGSVPTADQDLEPTPESDHKPRPASQPELDSVQEPSNATGPVPKLQPGSGLLPSRRTLRSSLPGAVLRERREWAQHRGYEFHKQDPYLVDEFTRGAAAAGAEPRDIVAGQVLGHEMLLMDIGSVAVMAMRTGAASDVVVDFRREGALDVESGDDLVPAFDVADFHIYSTHVPVVERLVDPRVRSALDAMPAVVTAVWMESEWVLAQMTKQARTLDWDAMQAPLALLADTARVLPPRSAAAQGFDPSAGDPTRAIEPQAAALAQGPTLVGPPQDEFVHPPVQRPDEPVQLPSRTGAEVHGTMAQHALGADEVDAIADGTERPHIDGDTPRMRRRLDGGSSLFDDGA